MKRYRFTGIGFSIDKALKYKKHNILIVLDAHDMSVGRRAAYKKISENPDIYDVTIQTGQQVSADVVLCCECVEA